MTEKQQALRTVGIYLRLLAQGMTGTTDECQRMSDLCFLMLPMKCRLSRKEIENIKEQAGYER